jgi:hypothetical protein
MSATNMSRAELDELLRRAGVAERRSGGRGSVFSEPVLVLMKWGEVYDQDGTPLASFRKAKDDERSFRQRVLTGPRWELVGLDGRVLLRVTRRGYTLTTIAADGSEVGVVKLNAVREGFMRRLHLFEVDREIIASMRLTRGGSYRVLGADHVQLGRITHQHESLIRQRRECNVIEIDGAMPNTLRRLMPAASQGVFHLHIPAG